MRHLLATKKKHISILVVIILLVSLWVPSAGAAGSRGRFSVQKTQQSLPENGEEITTNPMEDGSESLPDAELPTEPKADPIVDPQPPAKGSMGAGTVVKTSLSNGWISVGTAAAKTGDFVSVVFTITNAGNTPLTDPELYSLVPAGVSMQGVTGSGGALRFYQGTPPPLSSVGTIPSAGSVDPSGATAFSVDFVGRTLLPGESVSAEGNFLLNSGASGTIFATHQFSYTGKDNVGTLLPVAISTSVAYSTDAYYIEYSKPAAYSVVTGIPTVSAGLFDASGSKNLAIAAQQPATAGKVFSHWNTQADGLGTSYDSGATITLTRGGAKGLTLYPIWRANIFTVSFDSAGGETIAPITYVEGTQITQPTVTQAGYTLDGWYDDTNRKWNFSTDVMPSRNITLTARWTLVPVQQFRVTFLPENGSVTPAFLYVPVGTLITPPIATKAGYRLKHWVTSTNSVWNFSAQPMGTGNLSLKAVWELDTSYQYTVTHNANGGTVTPVTAKYAVGSKLALPIASREYYLLEGWKTPSGILWNFAVDTMPNSDLLLQAQWKFDMVGARLAVSFETGQGSIIPETQYIMHGAKILMPMSPRKVGYTFTGWRLKGDVKNWNFDTILREEHFVKPFPLVAQWQDNSTREVIVSYRANGGSPTPDNQKIMPGGLVERPVGVYRSGYTLTSWYTGPNTSYSRWNFDSDRVPADNANLVLYAHWSNDDRTGSSRRDTSPNLPGKYRPGKMEVITGSGVDGRPTEIPEVIVGGSEPESVQKPSSVTVGQQKPIGSGKPAGEVNPTTGGTKTVKPKQSPPAAAVVERVKESTTEIKEQFAEMTANANASELSMLWVALFFGIAAFLLFILGIIRRGRRR